MESDRGENLNSEVEDPLPDYHEAKGTHAIRGKRMGNPCDLEQNFPLN